MLQHVLYTACPPIVNGVLDRDLSAETLLAFPQIYKMGPQDKVCITVVRITVYSSFKVLASPF